MATMPTTIALALRVAPDIETARQLHDYGALDDAGVVAALEQTGLQRGSAQRWPGYLARVQQLAVVIDVAGDLTVAAFAADTLAQENTMLASLFVVLPAQASGCCVAWHGEDWPLLQQRAYHHYLPAPAAVHAWPRQTLADQFARAAVERDVQRLYGAEFADVDAGSDGRDAPDSADPILRDAVHYYAMALRQCCVTGALDRASARECTARAAARAVQASAGAQR